MPKRFETIADFYTVTRLSELLREDEIEVMTAGLSEQMDGPLVIVELDSDHELKVYRPFRLEGFLPPACQEARKNKEARCKKHEKTELLQFMRGGRIGSAGICWAKGVHFREGIKIGGVPVALAVGGGCRIKGDLNLSQEQKTYVEKIPSYTNAHVREIAQSRVRCPLEDREGKPLTWDKYREDYDRFVGKVELIWRIARDRFRSQRYDLEEHFFDTIRRNTYGTEFHLPKQEEEFKAAYRSGLEAMNKLCGYTSSVLMMYSKDHGSFRVYLSTLEPWQEKRIKSLQLSPNWESCFHWGKPIYVQPGLDMPMFKHKSGIETQKLSQDMEFLFPFPSIKRCCLFPFTAEDRRWMFFFIYEKQVPPFEDFFEDNRRLMETFGAQTLHGMSRVFAEMDRRDYLDRVAHETMNPIGKVKWHAEYIKMKYHDIEPGEVFRKLDDIINECNRAVRTAETILKLSGKMEIELKPENVDFFERIAKPIVHQIKYGRGDLYIEYKDLVKMPNLYLDSRLLYDVMFNILHNAVKYSSRHTTIIFSFEKQEGGVVLSVANTGIGIPEGEDERVFKPGVRGSNASQVDVRGTGQGLAICRMYIEEKLGGRIWFERGESKQLGKEVIFKVFLPKEFVTGG